MNSFELCNDSEVYSRYAIRRITLWTFAFVEISLNLRMKEEPNVKKPLATDERGG